MMNQSYITLPAGKVVAACEAYLLKQKLRLGKEKTEQLSAALKKRRFFGLLRSKAIKPHLSDVEFIADTKSQLESYVEANMLYNPEVQHVQKLMNLAKSGLICVGGDAVAALTVDDVAILFSFEKE